MCCFSSPGEERSTVISLLVDTVSLLQDISALERRENNDLSLTNREGQREING